ACQHLPAMGQELEQHIAQAQFARTALCDRQHDKPVALLHLGELVKLIEYDSWVCVPFQFDHDSHSVAIRFVAEVADTFEPLIIDQFGDSLDQARLVHLVGNLTHNNRRAAAALISLNGGSSANCDGAAPG